MVKYVLAKVLGEIREIRVDYTESHTKDITHVNAWEDALTDSNTKTIVKVGCGIWIVFWSGVLSVDLILVSV